MKQISNRPNQPNKRLSLRSLWRRTSLLTMALLVGASALIPMAGAAPGDYVWEKAGIEGIVGDNEQWQSIASSSDGTKLATVVAMGYIYTSIDSGATWTERSTAGSRDWSSIASSSDGSKLAATVTSGYIYTSIDSGATWTERSPAGSRDWSSIASSSDGTKLVATVNGGYIHTSTDSGATWTARMDDTPYNWSSVASSSDGTKLAVADFGASGYLPGNIYISTDSGVTWTQHLVGGKNHFWSSIASSSDGTKLVAAEVGYSGSWAGGYIYTSTDSGATWTARMDDTYRYWRSVASSADGSKLAAVSSSNVYTSTDSGATWTARMDDMSRNWVSVASSADGSKLAAVVGDDSIYTSSDSGATWTEQTVVGLLNWRSIASSNDGTHLAAISEKNEYIYTSTDNGNTWTAQTAAGLRYWQSITSSADGTKLAAVSGGSIYTSTDSGVTWIEQTVAGFVDGSIASSSDGTKLVATTYGGYIYTSVDSGVTWTERTAAGFSALPSIASSADGTKLIAISCPQVVIDSAVTSVHIQQQVSTASYASNCSIYTSIDSGVTWTERTSAGLRGWSALAISGDGSKLFATDDTGEDWNGGYVYTSTDSGATWIEQTAAGSRQWNSITSSFDGTKLAATAVYYDPETGTEIGSIYTSSDSGATWTEQTAAGSRDWFSVAMSFDGSRIIGAAYVDYVYLGIREPAATTTFDLDSLPTGSQAATESAVSGAQLSITSETCYTFDEPTIKTLSPTGVTAPDSTVNLLGGIAFNLNCTTTGGSSDVAIALGAAYNDTSQLRAYKGSGTTLTDITDQVTFTNQAVNGTTKTVLAYNLTDGGDYDEDGIANGTIVDPIYIGAVQGASATTPTGSGVLASTGINIFALTAVTIALFTGSGLLWKKSFSNK